jgi:ParB family chromosome partitioning protein
MDALNKNSKAGVDESPRARFRTKDISIFKMYRNKLNFYDLADIEELAGDILMYGLKQNLEVVFEPNEQGEYRIVAGERRWLALKHLVEQGYKDFEIATCKLTTPQDEDEEQVEIIIANAYRTKSLKDVIEEEQRLKACLERMKMDGKKIKGYDLQSGRLRDVIASMLKMSKTKIAQIESVNNNLIPEFREELNNERLTFSAAYELSGMSPEMQQEALGKFTETGELTHKDVKDMKAERAAGQQVSESDTETEIGMNPPEVRAGDEYETPHPEGITSICYSCTEYETCNVKTGTCTSCDQYKNRTEAYKTDEQRYSEEQDAIDRETKKKLREMEQEEKMQKLPSTAPEEIKTIRVSQDKFEEYTGEYRKPYMITKDDGFKVGNVVKLVVFTAGKATGETADMRITCKDDDITCSGLSDGWCVIGLGEA